MRKPNRGSMSGMCHIANWLSICLSAYLQHTHTRHTVVGLLLLLLLLLLFIDYIPQLVYSVCLYINAMIDAFFNIDVNSISIYKCMCKAVSRLSMLPNRRLFAYTSGIFVVLAVGEVYSIIQSGIPSLCEWNAWYSKNIGKVLFFFLLRRNIKSLCQSVLKINERKKY